MNVSPSLPKTASSRKFRRTAHTPQCCDCTLRPGTRGRRPEQICFWLANAPANVGCSPVAGCEGLEPEVSAGIPAAFSAAQISSSNLDLAAEFDDPVRRNAEEFRCRQRVTMHGLE